MIEQNNVNQLENDAQAIKTLSSQLMAKEAEFLSRLYKDGLAAVGQDTDRRFYWYKAHTPYLNITKGAIKKADESKSFTRSVLLA